MIKVTLKGDVVKEFESGITAYEVAKEISMGLYRNLCACLINGQSADIRTPINEDCELELLTFDSEEGKHAFWHTASHILAQAVKRLYPEAKLAIGPAIDNGFYYDFDSEISFTPEIIFVTVVSKPIPPKRPPTTAPSRREYTGEKRRIISTMATARPMIAPNALLIFIQI